MNFTSELETILNTQKLSKNTVKNYISALHSLQDLFKTDSIDFIITPETTIKAIEKEYIKPTIILTKINIIIVLIKSFYLGNKKYEKYDKIYKEYRSKLKDIVDTDYEKHEATETQKEKVITEEENDLIRNTLESKIKHNTKSRLDIINIRNYLIYEFLNTENTRGDFINSKLVLFKPTFKYDSKYNYIVINKKEKSVYYIQNQYKTVKTHKAQTKKLDNELYKYFNKLYNAYQKLNVEGDYAFYQDDLINQMNENNLSKLYSKFGETLINKPISIQVMRTQKSSEDYDKNSEVLENNKKKSQKMGHSQDTHNKIYSKKDLFKK